MALCNFSEVQRFWKVQENQKEFLETLGKELGFKTKEDWYNVTVKDFVSHGGRGLLAHYDQSPSKVLQAIYPQHIWSSTQTTPRINGY